MARSEKGSYSKVIERLFFARYKEGSRSVEFERAEIASAAHDVGVNVAKNLGDPVYSAKYRSGLPDAICATAPAGEEWRLVNAGRARYRFVLGPAFRVEPDLNRVETKIPDATPSIIAKYALNDEQALLAILRYNRLIDIFTGVTCYSLQNHLRTSVQVAPDSPETMQIETDEVYVGVDKRGVQYVFPVQAKGGRDKIALQQIEQDVLLCRQKFTRAICTPIAAQFMVNRSIALFAFEASEDHVKIGAERHYRLVPQDEISDEDLERYRQRLDVEGT